MWINASWPKQTCPKKVPQKTSRTPATSRAGILQIPNRWYQATWVGAKQIRCPTTRGWQRAPLSFASGLGFNRCRVWLKICGSISGIKKYPMKTDWNLFLNITRRSMLTVKPNWYLFITFHCTNCLASYLHHELHVTCHVWYMKWKNQRRKHQNHQPALLPADLCTLKNLLLRFQGVAFIHKLVLERQFVAVQLHPWDAQFGTAWCTATNYALKWKGANHILKCWQIYFQRLFCFSVSAHGVQSKCTVVCILKVQISGRFRDSTVYGLVSDMGLVIPNIGQTPGTGLIGDQLNQDSTITLIHLVEPFSTITKQD